MSWHEDCVLARRLPIVDKKWQITFLCNAGFVESARPSTLILERSQTEGLYYLESMRLDTSMSSKRHHWRGTEARWYVFVIKGERRMQKQFFLPKTLVFGAGKMKRVLFAFFIVCLIYANSAYAAVIDSDRLPPTGKWTHAGIPGGIPSSNYTNVICTAPTSPTDATSVIQACINAASDYTAVYLPAGTYRLNSGLSWSGKKIVLRGAGSDQTFIEYNGTGAAVTIGTAGDWGTYGTGNGYSGQNITSGYTKGSDTLVIADASAYSVGDIVIITQIDDGNPLVDRGNCNWNKRVYGGSYRSLAQMTEVKTVNTETDTITIDPPLWMTFESQYDPEIEKVHSSGSLTQYSGVEDLYITKLQAAGSQVINLQNTAYCWVKGVEIYKGHGRMINIERSFRNQIEQNYIHQAWTYTSGGYSYGIAVRWYSSFSLITNNIFCYFNATYFSETTGPGNVVSYNYMDGSWLDANGADGCWNRPDMGTHCAIPWMTLWEGNHASQYQFDSVHGGSLRNMLFRNYAKGRATMACEPTHRCLPVTDNGGAVDVRSGNYYISLVGNVWLEGSEEPGQYICGYTGYPGCNNTTVRVYKFSMDSTSYDRLFLHGNYDNYNYATVWESGYDQTLPDSYYLTEKPSWWDDQDAPGYSRPWPPIGPDVDGYVIDIPAKDRYEGELYSTASGSLSPPSNFHIVE